MKFKLLIISLFLSATSLGAQESAFLRERTFLTTDRDSYAAGEQILCSAFSMDSPATLSGFSAIAYVELVGTEGTVATGKIGLVNGRGAGSVAIPHDVPTGNYRITAYTACNKNEKGYDFMTGSRVISIYNTSLTAREKDAVEVVDQLSEAEAPAPMSGDVKVDIVPDGDYITVSLTSPVDASVSVSVFHELGLPRYSPASLASLIENAWDKPTTYERNAIPEYDGEIIRLKPGVPVDSLTLFLSSPGGRSDIYKGRAKEDGCVSFYTDNIFGDKDIAVVSLSSELSSGDIEIVSPFVSPETASVPVLEIAPSMRNAIETLDAAAKIKRAFDADTLYSLLPVRKLDPMNKYQNIYIIDDYTRFATMKEVFIEYLHDIFIRREGSRIRMDVKTLDAKGFPYYNHFAPSLILLDGVPVFDHNIIYDMDPALMKQVEIYPSYYAFGGTLFAGAANFVTITGDFAGTQLGRGTRIISFKGASIPRSYSPLPADGDPSFPRRDETLYWHPAITLQKGQPLEFQVLAPSYSGTFNLVIQGLTPDGSPINIVRSFEL